MYPSFIYFMSETFVHQLLQSLPHMTRWYVMSFLPELFEVETGSFWSLRDFSQLYQLLGSRLFIYTPTIWRNVCGFNSIVNPSIVSKENNNKETKQQKENKNNKETKKIKLGKLNRIQNRTIAFQINSVSVNQSPNNNIKLARLHQFLFQLIQLSHIINIELNSQQSHSSILTISFSTQLFHTTTRS